MRPFGLLEVEAAQEAVRLNIHCYQATLAASRSFLARGLCRRRSPRDATVRFVSPARKTTRLRPLRKHCRLAQSVTRIFMRVLFDDVHKTPLTGSINYIHDDLLGCRGTRHDFTINSSVKETRHHSTSPDFTRVPYNPRELSK